MEPFVSPWLHWPKAKTHIPCAIFPLGTGNVLARNLGIVKESILANPLEHAFDYLINGRPVKIDMALMNGEYFAGMAGVGPLSDAFMRPARALKNKFRLMAYVSAMIPNDCHAATLIQDYNRGNVLQSPSFRRVCRQCRRPGNGKTQ